MDPCSSPGGAPPDRVAAIMAIREASARARQAEVDELVLVADAADAFSWVDDVEPEGAETRAVLHGERLWRYGRDGTPEASDLLRFEVGPALGRSPETAGALIGEVLDLRHRFPRVWELVLNGYVAPWLARRMTHVAAPLSLELALEVDRRVAPYAPGWGPRRLLKQVESLVVHLDAEGAEERRRDELEDRFVAMDRGVGGVARLRGQLDAAPEAALEQTLVRLAGVLAEAGTEGDQRVLRARALETLADPAAAARLLGDECRGATPSGVATTLELVVHVQRDLLEMGGGGDSPRLGPMVRSQLDELVGSAAKVVVTPVIDLEEVRLSEAYEPPPAMRERVLLRNPTVVFPHSERSSHGRVDLDHTVEWPEGPTSEPNLGPLDRASHNVKTHGGFRLTQIRAGVFHWRTPCGQEKWVTPHGTFDFDPAIDRLLDPVGTRRRARRARVNNARDAAPTLPEAGEAA